MLGTLPKITLNKVKFKWTEVKQKALEGLKWIVARNTLSFYPYFNIMKYITILATFN